MVRKPLAKTPGRIAQNRPLDSAVEAALHLKAREAARDDDFTSFEQTFAKTPWSRLSRTPSFKIIGKMDHKDSKATYFNTFINLAWRHYSSISSTSSKPNIFSNSAAPPPPKAFKYEVPLPNYNNILNEEEQEGASLVQDLNSTHLKQVSEINEANLRRARLLKVPGIVRVVNGVKDGLRELVSDETDLETLIDWKDLELGVGEVLDYHLENQLDIAVNILASFYVHIINTSPPGIPLSRSKALGQLRGLNSREISDKLTATYRLESDPINGSTPITYAQLFTITAPKLVAKSLEGQPPSRALSFLNNIIRQNLDAPEIQFVYTGGTGAGHKARGGDEWINGGLHDDVGFLLGFAKAHGDQEGDIWNFQKLKEGRRVNKSASGTFLGPVANTTEIRQLEALAAKYPNEACKFGLSSTGYGGTVNSAATAVVSRIPIFTLPLPDISDHFSTINSIAEAVTSVTYQSSGSYNLAGSRSGLLVQHSSGTYLRTLIKNEECTLSQLEKDVIVTGYAPPSMKSTRKNSQVPGTAHYFTSLFKEDELSDVEPVNLFWNDIVEVGMKDSGMFHGEKYDQLPFEAKVEVTERMRRNFRERTIMFAITPSIFRIFPNNSGSQRSDEDVKREAGIILLDVGEGESGAVFFSPEFRAISSRGGTTSFSNLYATGVAITALFSKYASDRKWKVLDNGNRLRVIRAFNQKYKDLLLLLHTLSSFESYHESIRRKKLNLENASSILNPVITSIPSPTFTIRIPGNLEDYSIRDPKVSTEILRKKVQVIYAAGGAVVGGPGLKTTGVAKYTIDLPDVGSLNDAGKSIALSGDLDLNLQWANGKTNGRFLALVVGDCTRLVDENCPTEVWDNFKPGNVLKRVVHGRLEEVIVDLEDKKWKNFKKYLEESTAANANSVATTSTDVNIVGIASSEISKMKNQLDQIQLKMALSVLSDLGTNTSRDSVSAARTFVSSRISSILEGINSLRLQ